MLKVQKNWSKNHFKKSENVDLNKEKNHRKLSKTNEKSDKRG